MDIRVPGVSIYELQKFAESLDVGGAGAMGIGIYPTSQFVHVDFRAPGEPSFRWTDYSGHSPAKKPGRTQPARKPTGGVTPKAEIDKFVAGLARWPDVTALGSASLDDVLRMWAGLGYYTRARNLHACAVAVVRDHGAVFPDTEEGLRRLPGIGPYLNRLILGL